MKRLFAILLAVILLSGCADSGVYVPTGNGLDDQTGAAPPPGQTESREQQVSLVYHPDKGLNPYTCADRNNKMLFSLLYQSLFVTDQAYQTQPQLCKRYTVSEDGKTYIFYVENATFSDGTVLTASDVAASLEAARTGKIYSGRLSNVENISVTADGGVRLVMATAYENLPLLLNIPIVRGSQVASEHPDGTGPYALQSTASGLQLWLRQNWWCKADLPISAEQIPLVSVETTKNIRDLFELGQVNAVCADPAGERYVEFRSDYDLWDCENGVFLYLGCRAKSKVFSNETVRKALTHAIDRTSLVMNDYRTFAQAACLPASPSSPYYDKTLAAQYDYAPERFRAALAQEEMEQSSITLLVNKEDSHRVKVAQNIAAMLEACTLQVTVKAVSGDAYTAALNNGSYDLHLGQTVLSPNMDLSAFFDKGGALDFGGMNDGAISSLCKDALANSGNYETLHRAVMEDAMLCPVAFLSYAVYVTSDLVEDFFPARDCIFYYSLGKTMEEAKMNQ